MNIETLATFALTLGLPVWLLAEELARRVGARSRAPRATAEPSQQRAPVHPTRPAPRAA